MQLNSRGFSLVELLLTVVLAALLVGMALPSFSASIARHRQTAEINALFHALYLARKESIRRRQVVTLCPSADSETCQPGRDWSAGWILFENRDRDEPAYRDAAEPMIKAHTAGATVRIRANRTSFTSRGVRKRATNGTFVFCDEANRIPPRALVVSYTGRPRVSERRPDRQPLSCAD